MKERIILHIDANNAFLSWTAAEMLKNGKNIDIRNRYAVIAGSESERRGIVLAKSYPCKSKGVASAEPIFSARRKCPYLEIYQPDFRIYKKYSDAMYKYLSTYSDIIERYSIDECFIDYTNSQNLFGDPIKLAYKIKEDIKKNLGFTVNVGVGSNKLCAKMASDFSKPDKVHTLFPNEIAEKMWPLPISDLFMIGRSLSKKLLDLKINTIYELAHTDKNFLIQRFKSCGEMMYNYANGIDDSEVEYEKSNPKSISCSTVLPYNYSNKEEISKVLKNLSIEVGKKLRYNKMYAYTINIWIKYSDFNTYNKHFKLKNSTNNDIDIYNNALILFNQLWNQEPIRAACVGVTNFTDHNDIQLDIFNQTKQDNNFLQKTIDDINNKYKKSIITYADILKEKK